MNINVYIKSKIKDKNIKKAIDEYMKRLSRYCKINIKNLGKKADISSLLSEDRFSVNISSKMESMSSEALSSLISGLGIKGISNIDIFFDADSSIPFDKQICLTYLDFTEDMELMILAEQIYRAYRIMNGEPYHK